MFWSDEPVPALDLNRVWHIPLMQSLRDLRDTAVAQAVRCTALVVFDPDGTVEIQETSIDVGDRSG